MGRPIQIAPSVLPADFARLGDEVAALEKAGVDLIQWDVMDGQFVPNLTFGPDVIAAAREHASVPFEAHLMVLTPDVLAARYVEAGCRRLIVHAEACTHLHRTLGLIDELGADGRRGPQPGDAAAAVAHVLDLVDLVLVMTVNPGFGGQDYLPTMEPKIAEVRRLIERPDGRRPSTSRSTAASARPPSPARRPPAPTCSSPAAPCTATRTGLEHAVERAARPGVRRPAVAPPPHR